MLKISIIENLNIFRESVHIKSTKDEKIQSKSGLIIQKFNDY